MSSLLAVIAFLDGRLDSIDRSFRRDGRSRGCLLASDCPFGIGKSSAHCRGVDGFSAILDRVHDERVFRSHLRQQDGNVRFVANGIRRDAVEAIDQKTHAVHKLACAVAAVRRGFLELRKQFTVRG